mmetsp:Transcript_70559/g.187593  ORF Transcript_70559/g.187593 Transcript_70559/m.187593 type:complete len:294 (-) Transcript_70559:81-962(-)|eukprot:CAMPEP_0171201314 /NCGR_PEP_ID=MMETSP0790-20130122/24427_1 /TAXON_ID=2925 /ORGANISM="Alexandrium catenella, Strain OF101" /LENGTH=293 /DNA_ID=CAMNT_0011666711 /DNA_START=112 /DNA_END=993 /DNA_ORIENTATION=-
MNFRNRQPRALPEHVTSLAIRNIPAQVKQDSLLRLWLADGPSLNYLHLTIAIEAHRSALAIVNFQRHEDAVRFNETWHGKMLPSHVGKKSLNVAVAHLQGLRANLAYFRRETLENLALHGRLPVVMLRGVQLDARVAYVLLEGQEQGGHQERQAALPDGGHRHSAEPAGRGSMDNDGGWAGQPAGARQHGQPGDHYIPQELEQLANHEGTRTIQGLRGQAVGQAQSSTFHNPYTFLQPAHLEKPQIANVPWPMRLVSHHEVPILMMPNMTASTGSDCAGGVVSELGTLDGQEI